MVDSNTHSGGSNSSISSESSRRSSEKKVAFKNDSEAKKNDVAVPAVNKEKENLSKPKSQPPAILPRPKNHQIRPRSVTVGNFSTSDQESASQGVSGSADVEEESQSSEFLSFKEKAMIFGGAKQRSMPIQKEGR